MTKSREHTAPFHVLCIEDSPEDRANTRQMLLLGSSRRYIFTEVDTGALALRMLRDMPRPPDCILLDFKLPDMDALEIIAELRGGKSLPSCPVVVLTGVAESGPQVIVAGAQDFVGKSWASPESLTRAIESAVQRYNLALERERVADALYASEQVLRLFVQNAPAAVAQFDREMRYLCASGRWQQDYGFTGDITGRSHYELVPDLSDTMKAVYRRVLDGETMSSDGDRSVRADGSVRWEKWEALPWRDATGGIGGILMSSEDITERVRAEEELRRLAAELSDAARRKDEFLATLAHELRNPLAPIRSGLHVLQFTSGVGSAADEARMMLERQIAQMVRLVDDLLDVSRICGGKLQLRKERIELAGALHSAVEISRPLIDAGGHVLTVVVPSQPIFVDADMTRLGQVFANLLSNAAKFSERNGSIHLSVAFQGGNVLVSVKDAGIGITPDMLGSVFRMFSQVDQSLEKSQGGLGIGLSLVKQLVELHGGSVEARSAGAGQGSEFVVTLPMVAAVTRVVPPLLADDLLPIVSVPRRILVADDNEDAADSLAMLLTFLGHDVRTVGDGLAAVAMANAFRPEVILLDIGMPMLNGHDACRRIRAEPWSSAVLLIALTGWGQDDVRDLSVEAGFNHHIVKPVSLATLTRLLAEMPAALA
ncbi:response regulator [Gemmatimonas sp.]|uniref:hybrid sensor histidine kinase/response regulator n=1 Tax=Gemmatimonas sp. TaxID=1962908 RepID=UPI002869F313|nr:response regulator [Gemmatimonas sp.]